MISAVFAFGEKHKHMTANPVKETQRAKTVKERVRFLSYNVVRFRYRFN